MVSYTVVQDCGTNLHVCLSTACGYVCYTSINLSVSIFIMYTTLALQNCNHKLEITFSLYSAPPFQSLLCLLRTYFPNCNNTGSIEDSTRLCCYVIVIRLLLEYMDMYIFTEYGLIKDKTAFFSLL